MAQRFDKLNLRTSLVIGRTGHLDGAYPLDVWGQSRIRTGDSGGFTANASHDDLIIEGSANTGLQLFSPNTSYQYIAFGDTDGSNSGYIRYYHGTNEMRLRTNGSDNLTITGGGNVGIGTTNPQQKLHIEGNIYMGPNNTNNFIHSGAALGLQADGEVKIVSDVNDTSGGGGSDIIFGYGSSTNTDSNQDFTEAELSTYPRVEVMRIDVSTNSVGIGTDGPVRKLHVSTGNGDPAARFENTTSNATVLELVTSGDGRVMYLQTDHIYVNSGAMHFGNSTGDIYLRTSSAGGVGIGTTSPSHKLHVAGDVYSEKGFRLNRRVHYNFNGQTFDGENTATEGRRYTIGRVYYSKNHWGYYGTIKLEVNTRYPYNGTQTFLVQHSGNYADIRCIEAHGSSSFLSNVKVELGAETDTGVDYSNYDIVYKDIYLYLDRYLQARVYAEVDAHAFEYDKTTVVSGEYYMTTLFTTTANQNKTAVTEFSNYQTIQLTSNSNNKVHIAGNLGIGTTSPSQKLHIASSATAHLVSKLEQDNAGYQAWYEANSQDGGYARFGIGDNANNFAFWNTDQGSYKWYGSGVERMSLTNGGNLGIGTTSPDELLHLASTGEPKLILESHDGTQDCKVRFRTTRASTTTTNKAAVLALGTTNSTGTIEEVFFVNQNSVGIGTNSPAEKLHVAGRVRIGDYMKISSDSNYMGMIGFNRNIENGDIYNSSYGAYQLHNHQGKLYLQVYNSAGSATALHAFANNGNVGIGNPDPQFQLHVGGANGRLRVGPYYTSGGDRDFVDLIAHSTDSKIYSNNERFHIQNDSGDIIINPSGNVGIGTTSPSQKLHVAGNAIIGGHIYTTGNLQSTTSDPYTLLRGFTSSPNPENGIGSSYNVGVDENFFAGADINYTITATQNGSPISVGSNVFRATSNYWSLSVATNDIVVITITGFSFTHTCDFGLSFSTDGWRAKDVTIERTTDGGTTWNLVDSVSNYSYNTYKVNSNTGSSATNGIRYTLTNFNTTAIRLSNIFATRYTGGSSYFLQRFGDDTLNGALTVTGNLKLSSLGAGLLQTDADGLISVDTTSYSTFSGDYDDLTNKPTLGTAAAAATTDFAAASHTHAASDITSGTLANARLNEYIDRYTYQTYSSNGVYMPMVKGGLLTGGASTVTGRLRIKVPHYKAAIMQSFVIDVYEYNTDRMQSYIVSGYSYNNTDATWYNTSCIALADSDNRNLTVRFGSDETDDFQCVSIGETNTTWTYPQVVVRDYMAGHDASTSEVLGSWTIEFVTTDSATYDVSHTTNQPMVDKSRIAGTLTVAQGGTGATTAAGARTNLGVDPAGTDNSTNVTLVTTNHDYLSLSGQAITLNSINLDDINGGATAGLLKTNASGVLSVDTTSYSTFSGDYDDLTNKPTLGTAASSAATDFVAVTGDTMTGVLNLIQTNATPLNISTAHSSYTAVAIKNTGTGNAGIYFDAIDGDLVGSDYGFIGQNNAGYMEYHIGTSSPAKYHVFTNGNVGIGTTNPGAKLEVSGNTLITGNANVNAQVRAGYQVSTADARVSAGDGRTGDGNAYVDLIGDATYTAYGLRLWRAGGLNASSYISHRGTGTMYIRNLEAAAMHFQTGGTDKMVISSGGNLQLSAYGAGILQTDASGNVTAGTASTLVQSNIYSPVGWKLTASTYTAGGQDITSSTTQAYSGTTPVTRTSSTVFTATTAGTYEVRYQFVIKNNYANRCIVGAQVKDTSGSVILGSRSFEYLRYTTYGEYNTIQATFYTTIDANNTFNLETALRSGSLNYTLESETGANAGYISFRLIKES